VNSRHHDVRLSPAEAAVLLQLARRLRDETSLANQLNPAELVVVTNLVDVLDGASVGAR
jgi:hypothetical protein